MTAGRATTFVVGLLVAAGSLWWLFPDRLLWEKAATVLAAPVAIVWCLLFLTFLVALAARQRLLASLTLCAWLILSVAGNEYVARMAMKALESPYLTIDPLEQPPMSTIVVLGGGVSSNARGAAQLDLAGDRLALTASLYHAGLAERVVCTGGFIAGMDVGGGRAQGELARELLVGLGIPADRIQTVGGRTTSEEMRALADQLTDEHRVGLVTSASHLNRALRLASEAGLEFVPLPCDFAARSHLRPLPMHFIPTGYALDLSARTFKEYLAAAVGR